MMNANDLFRNSRCSMRSPRLQMITRALFWQQRYMRCEFYEYTFNDYLSSGDNSSSCNSDITNECNSSLSESNKCLRLRQISNGEMKGLGTGTYVWPASHILAKYLEKQCGHRNANCGREETRGGGGEEVGGNWLRGKKVCDIGSGAGLPGYVAAYLGKYCRLY